MNLSFDFPALPSDHIMNGGTFVTVLSTHRIDEVIATLKQYDKDDIWIVHGSGNHGGVELHANKKDLSDFWALHRTLFPK